MADSARPAGPDAGSGTQEEAITMDLRSHWKDKIGVGGTIAIRIRKQTPEKHSPTSEYVELPQMLDAIRPAAGLVGRMAPAPADGSQLQVKRFGQ